MRLGILSTCQFSMFSGGLANTTIALYEVYKVLGYDVVLLNTNSLVEWFEDCKGLQNTIVVENIDKDISSYENRFDLIIELVPYFENEKQRNIFSKKNIFLYRKNILIPTIEHSLYPVNIGKDNFDGVSEIWTFNELITDDEKQILETLTRLPVVTMPYLWTPSIIEAHKTECNLPLWIQYQDMIIQNGNIPLWSPHICETNTTSSSSSTIPIVIMKQAKVEGFPFNKYKIHNMDQIIKSQYFKDNIEKHCIIEDLSGIYIGRQRMIDMVGESMSCVISHIRFIPFKPILFDLAWFGIPFIHNSNRLNSFSCFERYYYPNNKISVAVEKLKLIHTDFVEKKGWFALENIQNFRTQILNEFTCLNPAIQEIYKNTVEKIEILENNEQKEVTSKKKYVLLFTDMWENFNPTYNFFSLMLLEATKDKNINIEFCGEGTLKGTPDALVFGPFGDCWKAYINVPKIHYTGENTQPIQDPSVKLNLGFQHADMVSDGYLRFPLWLLEIDWFHCDVEKMANPKPIPLERCTKVFYNEIERKKFCAFIVSNPTNEIRNHAYHWINTYKEVDSAGRLFNNVGDKIFAGGGGGGGELKKLEFLKDYKFCITYENSSSQGYTTEKLLHAKAAGCIPIYWGDPKVERDFNTQGFIDARNIYTMEGLINAVKNIDTNNEEYLKKYSTPALDDYKVDWARRTISQCASCILKIMDVQTNVERFVGNREVQETEKEIKIKSTSVETPLLVTYATRQFLPSLFQWLSSFEAQRNSIKDLRAIIFIGDDVSEESKKKLKETYTFIDFYELPKQVPDNFKDIFDGQHYAWKIYIYQFLVNNEKYKDQMIFYLDSGIFMCRWPSTYLKLAQDNDICVLLDDEQYNKQWCHKKSIQIMKITSEELQKNQIVGGIFAFRAGSEVAKNYFNEAWSYAQIRDCIVGEKWEGLRDGKPYGHRHDQSILSILSLRYNLATYPLHNLYCDISLRRTFLTNKFLYVHRGNLKIHDQFIPGIDDCFVINLKRRADRLEKLYSNSPEFKNKIIEFEAFEGKKLKLSKDLARLFKPHDFMWKKAIMGCALSHLQLWYQLANEKPDITNYLILEDDVKFVPGWQEKWVQALPSLPENYDVIYLGGILPPNREGFEVSKDPVNAYFSRVKENQFFGQTEPNRYFHWCAYSYVLSKQGAQKILAIIDGKDGYYTSADHMICNPIDFMNIYFLDPLVAGCYQDDDPIYKNAEFNNFNRVDGFDSDLWNNDERFTNEEIKIMGNELNIPSALADAKQSIHTYTKSLTSPVIKNTSNVFNRLCMLEEHKLSWDLLYEHSWLYELLGKPSTIELQSVKAEEMPNVENPIFIILNNHIESYTKLFTYYESKGFKYNILHLGDEHGLDNIEFYNFDCCKSVVRNYVRKDLLAKVLVIPLGYHFTINNGIDSPYERTPQLPFRSNLWSFFGTNWNNREAILEPLKILGKHQLQLYKEWNDSESLKKEEYTSVLLDTVFVPCIGGQNAETFRFYEALECGCIPILINDEESKEYYSYISTHIPLINLPNWSVVPSFINHIFNDKDTLQQYRFIILNSYKTWKQNLKEEIKKIFNI